MRRLNEFSSLPLVLALGVWACSPSEAGDASPRNPESSGSSVERAVVITDPEEGELLVPPPPGAEFQSEASEFENEDESDGPSVYGSDGNYEAEHSVSYVFATDQSLEAVARYYLEVQEETLHYVDMEELIDWDQGPDALNIEEEAAAALPPDELTASLAQYREQGLMTEEEYRESLENADLYRKLYPKIKDVIISSLYFDIEEAWEDGASEPPAEYRYVEVEISRPFVDVPALEVRDRTEILYTVHKMVRQGN